MTVLVVMVVVGDGVTGDGGGSVDGCDGGCGDGISNDGCGSVGDGGDGGEGDDGGDGGCGDGVDGDGVTVDDSVSKELL